MKEKFVVYTDGSCNNLKEPHYGGWAFVVLQDGKICDFGKGACINTTNNRMEIRAVVSALMTLHENSDVSVFTDSQYCITALEKEFRKSAKNSDMINCYHIVVKNKNLNVEFNWVKGHNGDKFNEMVDKMANGEYERVSGEKLPDFKKLKKINNEIKQR